MRASLRSGYQATVHILSKSSRQSIDSNLKRRRRSQAGVASHPLLPTEAPMRALCARLHRIIADRWVFFRLRRATGDLDGLRAKHTHEVPAKLTARPISPQDRVRSRLRRRRLWRGLGRNGCGGVEGPENSTDLPRLPGRWSFLTLRSKRARTAMPQPCSVDNPQRAMAFRSALLHG